MRLLLLGLSFTLIIPLAAQQRIEGLIINAKEEPLRFAHAVNLTMQIGQVSDINGRFNLLVKKGDTVRFSFIGYISKELVIESIHLPNYLKITLPQDSLLLPSITIYADPNYMIPLNYKGESMEVQGIATSDKKPLGAGSIGPNETGGVGITLYGPITMFSKDAREARKFQKARNEKTETIFYQQFIEADSVRNKICKLYELDTLEYERLIIAAHQNYPEVQTLNKPQDIWNWLIGYFRDQTKN